MAARVAEPTEDKIKTLLENKTPENTKKATKCGISVVLTAEEAERRGQMYDQQGVIYLFDLDYVVDVFTVDAAHYGNIPHFVNHSCDPNLRAYNIFIDNLDERFPRIAFFAIRAGEELTFDYKKTIDEVDAESTKMDTNFSLAGMLDKPISQIHMECKYGVQNCRKYLF